MERRKTVGKTVQLALRLPYELHKRVKEVCFRGEISLTKFAIDALEAALKKPKQKTKSGDTDE